MREHAHGRDEPLRINRQPEYLNAAERQRFAKAARRTPTAVRLFCLTLCLSGGRISEILALTPGGHRHR